MINNTRYPRSKRFGNPSALQLFGNKCRLAICETADQLLIKWRLFTAGRQMIIIDQLCKNGVNSVSHRKVISYTLEKCHLSSFQWVVNSVKKKDDILHYFEFIQLGEALYWNPDVSQLCGNAMNAAGSCESAVVNNMADPYFPPFLTSAGPNLFWFELLWCSKQSSSVFLHKTFRRNFHVTVEERWRNGGTSNMISKDNLVIFWHFLISPTYRSARICCYRGS
jgi:hypothetical protein